jgi:hypothetical protein
VLLTVWENKTLCNNVGWRFCASVWIVDLVCVILIVKLGQEKKTLDIANLNEQLDLLGLKICPVTADGNCFFR